ncbi:hypothetical protein CEXT_740921 [Caerostris extrusa]|uniref:Uncharacterized protein n=1 Tax=Caerostris extrusa TaxID=172846 RepID=A0AAV4XM20_CAEEX|nr:hypothetical protein CEXT_740921 [Caerostris extrusa]
MSPTNHTYITVAVTIPIYSTMSRTNPTYTTAAITILTFDHYNSDHNDYYFFPYSTMAPEFYILNYNSNFSTLDPTNPTYFTIVIPIPTCGHYK